MLMPHIVSANLISITKTTAVRTDRLSTVECWRTVYDDDDDATALQGHVHVTVLQTGAHYCFTITPL